MNGIEMLEGMLKDKLQIMKMITIPQANGDNVVLTEYILCGKYKLVVVSEVDKNDNSNEYEFQNGRWRNRT